MSHQLIIFWGSAIFIIILVVILWHASPAPFIHVCFHYHWYPHYLSMTKHASVHYFFAAIQNVRNNLSDTPAMFVMIDTAFKSLNVLQRTQDLKLCVNLYISSSFKSPLLCCHCSSLMFHIFSISTPSHFRLFRCFPNLSEPVLLPSMSKMFLCIHLTWAIDFTINHSSYTCQYSNLLGQLSVT